MERSLTTDTQRRQVSAREMELMLMRKRLRNVQQQAYVREMEAREMERIKMFRSYPYYGDDELYYDSIREFKEEDNKGPKNI